MEDRIYFHGMRADSPPADELCARAMAALESFDWGRFNCSNR